MIVYSATRREFTEDVHSNQIEARILDAFESRAGRAVAPNEIQAWKNSMLYMNNVLVSGNVSEDAGVAIEYTIPLTAKRVDFILSGQDEDRRDCAVIVELKQWSEVSATGKDGVVETFVGGTSREVAHPSYQAWTYAALIEDFNEAVRDGAVRLAPCAYLHSCTSDGAVRHADYSEHLDRAPAFLKKDAKKLERFIAKYVKHGDSRNILYRIENGRLSPSKSLTDHLVSLLHGNREFLLIDDQKVVYEQALDLCEKAGEGAKQVLVVKGGPGTGKSVVAINLLVEMTRRGKLAQYVTRNAAPRAVYEAKLTKSFKKTRITNLFKSSGSYVGCDPDQFEALVVDEAHRLNEKSGMFRNLGENQIKEIIEASRFSVFFVDEDQRVTFRDIGETAEIEKWSSASGAHVQLTELASQFRCNGSDGYLAWVDNALQIRETANRALDGDSYDFRVLDSPNELHRLIVEKNRATNKARMVAGYCWDWKGKKDPSIRDVTIPEHGFAARWNLDKDGHLWILQPGSENEIGCIHTCQGLELEYVGVILGEDFVVRDGRVVTDAAKRSSQDSSVHGYKKMLKQDPERARALADLVIKNTYRTLLTRGQKGCFVYCVDPETNEYFKSLCAGVSPAEEVAPERYPGLGLRVLGPDEARPYENCVPIFDLAMAAGAFSEEQLVEDPDWVELPDSFRPQKGHFVTRVVGESMNRRIPNGAWCLFKRNPGGTRNGKVVIVQHRDLQDPEIGTQCTVKVYSSEKRPDAEGWVHETITLSPDSTEPGFHSIILDSDKNGSVNVVGELVAVLGS